MTQKRKPPWGMFLIGLVLVLLVSYYAAGLFSLDGVTMQNYQDKLTYNQCLLAGEGIGHRVGVGAADLDIVAEHLVEADFQLGDAGFLAVAGLKV